MTAKALAGGLMGFGLGLGVPVVVRRAVLARAQRGMEHLRRGTVDTALRDYSSNAILRLGEGRHRWAGDHVGRAAIERFLRMFAEAGLVGIFREAWTSGPPWALRVALLFDECAADETGSEVYRNELMMLMQTRWGRIVEHVDFAFSTGRIEEFERHISTTPAPQPVRADGHAAG